MGAVQPPIAAVLTPPLIIVEGIISDEGIAAAGEDPAGVVLFAMNPRPVRGWVLRIFGSGRRVRTVLRWIHELHGSLLIYARKGKLALVLATLSGALHFGGRFLLGWGVLRGFGIEAGFWNIVTLHVLLQFLLIFMPTPGGSGVGEILAPALMRPFLPSSLLVAYTAVWRFFLTYVNVLAGGGLLLRWVGVDQAKLAANEGGSASPEPPRDGEADVGDR